MCKLGDLQVCVELKGLLLQVAISFFQFSELGLEVFVSRNVFFYSGNVLFETVGCVCVFNSF